MVSTVVLLLLTLTLGIAVAAFTAACLLWSPRQRIISQMLFVVSALFAPFAAFVILFYCGIYLRWPVDAAVAMLLLALYAVTYAMTKRNILVLICTAFATWLYFAFVLHIIGNNPLSGGLIESAIVLLGAILVAVSYEYRRAASPDAKDAGDRRFVSGALSFVGTFAILGEGIVLGGVFDFFYLALVFCALYGSRHLKDRGMLVLGVLFLALYVLKVAAAVYVQSIGWPVALIIFGVAVGGCYQLFFTKLATA